ncbi:translocator protein, LysE family [Bordetella bronchiseptica GA96-01]|uniref:LysE family translocator n=1 Tax=Bordetella bronchiseptica TaxID=518 RepID=UPI0004594587|nr:LysE family translocator [Bordetella bronchiseptica]AZW31378.1 LysE family translocator [Bordetella bronchiseptica]KCV39215.1 translocator protein, LysE family [Bordetella bronchiseptica 345]KDC42299.1 translocator protein, LysE family [Bordetella bronchiseptica GA96-01]
MSLLAFLLAAALLAITPGPGIAYVVARTVAGGRAEGLASCLGTALGGLVHVLAAALGLSVLIAESALAFSLLKYAGAAYLVYLGLRMWLRPRPAAVRVVAPQGARRALTEGVLVEALNVKTALFFLAFLPQFVDPGAPLAPQLALLGCICVTLNTLVDVMAVAAAHRLLRSEAARVARARVLTRVSGTTMVGLGVFLALARRD